MKKCLDCDAQVPQARRLCPPCAKARNREAARRWREANPEKAREATRKTMARRRKEAPAAIAWAKAKSKYRLTEESYAAMLAEADGKCLVCAQSFTEAGTGKIVIDHHHGSGQVRGLICSGCNTAIGYVREDIERMTRMISYLRTHGK